MKNDKQAVISAFETFVKAGDQRDLSGLEEILHPEFRVVLNQAFGSAELMVWNKETYLEMARSGKIGGSERGIKVRKVLVNGNNAFVEADLSSGPMDFFGQYSFVRNAEGKWQLLQDLPRVVKKG